MPIKWSALKVSEAIDMVEECVNQVVEPLEQAKLIVNEARKIPNLPQYVDQRLVRLIIDIKRLDGIKTSIVAIRQELPDGVIEAEKKKLESGSQLSLAA